MDFFTRTWKTLNDASGSRRREKKNGMAYPPWRSPDAGPEPTPCWSLLAPRLTPAPQAIGDGMGKLLAAVMSSEITMPLHAWLSDWNAAPIFQFAPTSTGWKARAWNGTRGSLQLAVCLESIVASSSPVILFRMDVAKAYLCIVILACTQPRGRGSFDQLGLARNTD